MANGIERLVPTLAAAAVLGGCAFGHDNATFVTKTSLAIDFDTQPPALSIGYDRIEGFAGPRFSAGGVPNVAGFIDAKGTILDRKIHQVYATGGAARAVVTGQAPTGDDDRLQGTRDPMFFGTSTATGLKVTFNPGLQELVFGHKRKELSVIPLRTPTTADGDTYVYPSVFASIDNGYQVGADAPATQSGIKQFFATGKTAEAIAAQQRFVNLFREKAAEAVLKYRSQERLQRQSALDTLYCFSLLPDDRVAAVRDDAEKHKLFGDPQALRRATAPAEIRAAYTGELGITDAADPAVTTRLAEHQKFVCKLAGK